MTVTFHSFAVRNVPYAVAFLVFAQVGDIGLLRVSLDAPTWSNELVVDSNVWWTWQWLLFIILEDSDDDSNLSDDFYEIKN